MSLKFSQLTMASHLLTKKVELTLSVLESSLISILFTEIFIGRWSTRVADQHKKILVISNFSQVLGTLQILNKISTTSLIQCWGWLVTKILDEKWCPSMVSPSLMRSSFFLTHFGPVYKLSEAKCLHSKYFNLDHKILIYGSLHYL